MKSLFAFLLFVLASSSAFAANPLDSIWGIVCADAAPQPDQTVLFTTDNSQTQKYTRRSGTIPYSYTNLQSLSMGGHTGQLILQNDPNTSGGQWVLSDTNTLPNQEVTLVLKPRDSHLIVYQGQFSGPLEIDGVSTDSRVNRLLICQMVPKFLSRGLRR